LIEAAAFGDQRASALGSWAVGAYRLSGIDAAASRFFPSRHKESPVSFETGLVFDSGGLTRPQQPARNNGVLAGWRAFQA